ncbi:PglL family O-oligosaccharyltransferase [Oceanisphaera pacifica]|uniref:O-antigen ligase C-terminal domain-containing protein n=1 Tax=Oceanisphaera pacifica TaxID=2818389 RepID=A0ABS3NGP4_9GAMM|nr:Wzy polymerase domain-containing protein [Oceanisphaera pacifica]MBO1519741.1 O-antigen ligase C-terminal domain-containing protein [Oceanisphaera pacifica]
MNEVWKGPGRWVLALFFVWALVGQHVFIHHLGGSDLDLPFNAISWLFVGAVFIAGAVVLHSRLAAGEQIQVSSSALWNWFSFATVLLWLPWLFALAADLVSLGLNMQAAYWQALPRLLGVSAGLLLFWVLQQCQFNARQRYFLLCTLLLLATVQIGFGLVQFFVLPADNWFMFNTKVRFPYGIFMQRNVMSSFVGSGVLLALYLLVRRSGGTGREHWRWWLWCSAVAAAGLVLVVLLQSRAGLYSLLAGLCLLLPVCWMRLTSRLQRTVLLALVVCGAGAGLALLVHFDLHRRALAVYGELGVRYEIWRTTLGLIAQNIWLGVGYGQFEPAYYAEAGRVFAASGVMPEMGGNLHHPHNEILMWWLEGGVITLLAWALLAWGVLGVLWRLSMGERLAMVALCLPLFAHLMSEYPMGHSSVHWIWLLVVVWYFDCESKSLKLEAGEEIAFSLKPEAGRSRKIKLAAVGLLVIGCGVVLYMATGLQTGYQLTQYQRGHFSEPKQLDAVSNPWFWGDRQALYRNSRLLTLAIKEQDLAAVQEYLVWSTAITARLPRTTLLHNHLVALFVADQLAPQGQSASDDWLAQLQLNYPRQRLFKEAALTKIKTQLATGEVPRIFQHLTPPVGSATYY